jgi:hypothetical protein
MKASLLLSLGNFFLIPESILKAFHNLIHFFHTGILLLLTVEPLQGQVEEPDHDDNVRVDRGIQ